MTDPRHVPMPSVRTIARYRRQMTRRAFRSWLTAHETLAALDPATQAPPEPRTPTRQERREQDRVAIRNREAADQRAAHDAGVSILLFHARTRLAAANGLERLARTTS